MSEHDKTMTTEVLLARYTAGERGVRAVDPRDADLADIKSSVVRFGLGSGDVMGMEWGDEMGLERGVDADYSVAVASPHLECRVGTPTSAAASTRRMTLRCDPRAREHQLS
ncbi:MAG: hypothetical protein OXC25_08770 [Thiotrichales bacterium]|nr:hypothetical protein [Thiotrichales bacterium]